MRSKHIKTVFIFLTAALLNAALLGCANKKTEMELPPGIDLGEAVTITASVEAIDYATRHVTLKGPEGNTVTLYVDENAYNFENVHVGDLVEITHYQSLAIQVAKSDKEPAALAGSGITRAPKGQKPEGMVYSVIDVTAKVEKIDYQTRMVSLRGPAGNVIQIEVDERVKNLEAIKPGDNVAAKYIEAMAISVKPADPAAK